MKFEMLIKPGVPNVNRITYSKECWNNFLINTDLEEHKIPVTDIDYNTFNTLSDTDESEIPPQNLLGFVSSFEDNSVVFDPVNNPDIKKRLKQYKAEGRKAFMRYIGAVDFINGEKVITDIAEIISIDIEPEDIAKENNEEYTRHLIDLEVIK